MDTNNLMHLEKQNYNFIEQWLHSNFTNFGIVKVVGVDKSLISKKIKKYSFGVKLYHEDVS